MSMVAAGGICFRTLFSFGCRFTEEARRLSDCKRLFRIRAASLAAANLEPNLKVLIGCVRTLAYCKCAFPGAAPQTFAR